MLPNLLIYGLAFGTIWFGSGWIVSSVSKLSHRLRISSFLISFVILGILTSTPEMAVGLSAVSAGTPGIFVGTLLGGIPVLFLLVIPLLAVVGRGLKLTHNLDAGSILLAMIMSLSPFIVVLDHQVTALEGVFLIGLYLIVIYLLQRKNSFLVAHHVQFLKVKSYSFVDLAKVFFGVVIVLLSSNIIVSKTLYFSHVLNIAPFYISLIVLSLGTNLPELTLALRSLVTGGKDVALGDYLGSASANGLLFGIFTLLTPDKTLSVDNFLAVFILMAVGLGLFYHFARSKRDISVKEGLVLLTIYVIFIVVELLPH